MTFIIPEIIQEIKSWKKALVLTMKFVKGIGSIKLERYPAKIFFG